MISAWWLLLIVPVAVCAGAYAAALFISADIEDGESSGY